MGFPFHAPVGRSVLKVDPNDPKAWENCVPPEGVASFKRIMQPYSNHSELLPLGQSVGLGWKSVKDVDAWLAKWEKPCPAPLKPAAYEHQEAKLKDFKDIADGIGKVKWDKVEWPSGIGTDGKVVKSNLAFQGAMIQGMFYTVAFATSWSKDGKVKWVDFVQGFGGIAANMANFVPTVGPFLSGFLTFALAFFGSSSPSIGEQIEKALKALYEKIMKEVGDMMKKQLVESALVSCRETVSDLVRSLESMPLDLHPITDTMPAGEYRVQKVAYYGTKTSIMESQMKDIFGASVGCYSNGRFNDSPPDTCKHFLYKGAFYFQFQFVLLHLNFLAEWARTVEGTAIQVRLEALRRMAQKYVPLLDRSLEIFLSFRTTCSYNYPECWGQCRDARPCIPGTPCLPCGIGNKCHESTAELQRQERDEDVLERTRCVTNAKGEIFGARNLCEREGGPGKVCSQGDFDGYWEAFAENVRNNFDPLLAILRKLTQEIPDATALVEQLVKDPVKERSTVSGAKTTDPALCDSACDKLGDAAGLWFKQTVVDTCKPFCLHTDITTRPECMDKMVESIPALFRGQVRPFLGAACAAFPLFEPLE